MKSYKTKEELLNHLKEDRHVELEESLLPIFDIYRYGQIIDAYKDLLATYIVGEHRIHVYDKNITLNSFVNAMNIDEYISIKLITFISHYEKILKKFISDKVCESMVANGFGDCCDYTCFNDMKDDGMKVALNCFIPLDKQYDKNCNLVLRDKNTFESRIRVIDKIIGFASGTNNSELNYYVNDYYLNNHAIPFYILIGSLSFTNLIVLFEMLDKNLQFDFMKNIQGKTFIDNKDIVTLSSKHYVMKRIRNIIHHHEPLIPFLYKKEYLDFDTKKAAIKILRNVYEKFDCIDKLIIRSNVDFDFVKSLKNNSGKKLEEYITTIK